MSYIGIVNAEGNVYDYMSMLDGVHWHKEGSPKMVNDVVEE